MNKDDIRNALTYYEMMVLDQRNRITDLRYQVETGREEEVAETAIQFCKNNETIYLKLKELIYEMQGVKSSNIYEKIGTTDEFPSSLDEIKKGVWKFHLPPFFSVSAKKKAYNEGKHVHYLVLNLLMDYEYEHKKIKKMEKPVVLFRHHICSEAGLVFDYDNIDSKRAIDAMQGFFLKDDNAVYLTTIHEAMYDPDESFCDIYIFDQAKNGPYLNAETEEILSENSAF